MGRFKVTAAARSDLEDIHDFIASDNPDRALSFIDEMTERFRFLAANPLAGPSREDIRPELRIHPYGRYVICYRTAPYGVDILRVFQGARLWGRILKG